MLQIAIIGLGYWGPNLVRVFSEIPDCKVKAICDSSKERLDYVSGKYPHLQKSQDYEQMLQDKSIDAVIVATNLSSHYKIARDVLNAKKHLFIEKPLTPDTKEAEELAALAKKNKVILMVGHTFLYNMGVRKLKEYVDSKYLGNLLYLHAARTNLGPIRKDTNALWDLASHDIAVFLYLINKLPTSVTTRGGTYIKSGNHDVVFLTINFPDNVIANIHASWLEPCKVRNLTLIGDKKMVVFDDISQLEPIKIYDKGVIKEKKFDNFGEFQLILRDGDVIIPKIAMSEPLKNECTEFITSIKSDKTPLSDGDFGARVVKVLYAAQKSLENNGQPEEIK